MHNGFLREREVLAKLVDIPRVVDGVGRGGKEEGEKGARERREVEAVGRVVRREGGRGGTIRRGSGKLSGLRV